MKAFDKKYITNSAQETQKIGQMLGKRFKKGDLPAGRQVFIALFGELGGGKTTFVQGLVRGLGIKRRIISPTFIILRKYKISPPRSPFPLRQGFAGRVGHLGGGETNFYHVDLYRIENQREIEELGLREIIDAGKDIVAIEWAEKMGELLPKNRWEINFEYINDNKRRVIIRELRTKN